MAGLYETVGAMDSSAGVLGLVYRPAMRIWSIAASIWWPERKGLMRGTVPIIGATIDGNPLHHNPPRLDAWFDAINASIHEIELQDVDGYIRFGQQLSGEAKIAPTDRRKIKRLERFRFTVYQEITRGEADAILDRAKEGGHLNFQCDSLRVKCVISAPVKLPDIYKLDLPESLEVECSNPWRVTTDLVSPWALDEA